MESSVKLIEAMGLTVVPVPGLKDNVVYVPNQGVVLVHPDLDDEDWDDALDYLIHAAMIDR